MDPTSEVRLLALHPRLAGLVRQMDTVYRKIYRGDFLKVEQGMRTWEAQKILWDKGRDANGNIVNAGIVVTHAPPGHSWHQFGLAVDLCPATLVSVDGWAPTSPRWKEIGSIGESFGLIWGGRWLPPKTDLPHFQLTGSLPVSPNEIVRDAYAQGGVDAVWTAAGLYTDQSSAKDA
jgi:peptidoglycan L-alanyl-D-glutamate endopeptidase CwlK